VASGVFVVLAAHLVGMLLIVFSLALVLMGVLLTMTVIGAVIGIPLVFLGALTLAFGAAGLGGGSSALVLGVVAGLVVFAVARRSERHPAT
jgi:hypothetical protein